MPNTLQQITLTTLALGLWLFLLCCPAGADTLRREDFHDLSNWQHQPFEKIPTHTTYTIERIDTGYGLKASSQSSASAIINDLKWDVMKYPVLQFRWKVSNVYSKGDATTKAGDDFPIRIYVAFTDSNPSWLDTVIRSVLEAIYKRPIPHSALTYVWGNKQTATRITPSPHTDRICIIPLQGGTIHTNQWKIQTVNLLEDYKEAFGELPPGPASIAIMNDSDNTSEQSVSWIDYITIKN